MNYDVPKNHPLLGFNKLMSRTNSKMASLFDTGGDMMRIDPMMDLSDMEQTKRIERFLEDIGKQAKAKRHEDLRVHAPRRAGSVLVEVDPFIVPYLYAYAARAVAVKAAAETFVTHPDTDTDGG